MTDTKPPQEKLLEGILFFVFVPPLIIYGVWSWSVVISFLWKWFVVPAWHQEQLSFGQSLAVSVFVALIVTRTRPSDGKGLRGFWSGIPIMLLSPWVFFLSMSVVNFFFNR